MKRGFIVTPPVAPEQNPRTNSRKTVPNNHGGKLGAKPDSTGKGTVEENMVKSIILFFAKESGPLYG